MYKCMFPMKFRLLSITTLNIGSHKKISHILWPIRNFLKRFKSIFLNIKNFLYIQIKRNRNRVKTLSLFIPQKIYKSTEESISLGNIIFFQLSKKKKETKRIIKCVKEDISPSIQNTFISEQRTISFKLEKMLFLLIFN